MSLKKSRIMGWEHPPRKMHDGWSIWWITDEGILLSDGRFNTRERARAACREKRSEGWDCFVFRNVLVRA